MRGVHSYLGWTHIPDIDSNTSSADDNPFAAPKQQPVGKVGVNLPTDVWLSRKMDSLNLTLTQGYPSRSSETGGLQRDQFVKRSKSHTKWYRPHPNQDRLTGSVSFWHCDSAKLNSAYSQIARSSGFTSPAPNSHTLSQDTLRHWEKAATESTNVCNQAAGLGRCLSKVQQGMLRVLQSEQAQRKSAGKVGDAGMLRVLQSEQAQGKSAGKVGAAMEELQYLINLQQYHTVCSQGHGIPL